LKKEGVAMSPRVRLVVGLIGFAIVFGSAGVASGQQPPVPAGPKVEQFQPKVESSARSPYSDEGAPSLAAQKGAGVLSDLLTVFIIVALIVAVVTGVVLVFGLFFRLRTAEHPVLAALDDAWVQGRLRELEAAPPEPETADQPEAAEKPAAVEAPVEPAGVK
jgi:hypothetical protein